MPTPVYTRENPSPDYAALLAQYRALHRDGERAIGIPAEETFAGATLLRFVEPIKDLIDRFSAATVLDYGSGKGRQYAPMRVTLPDGTAFDSLPAYWGVRVTCYDPAFPDHAARPSGRFDGVVCTDVLEHCPKADIPWIVDELFGFARKFLFASISVVPAEKCLPDGRNAHVTIEPSAWWRRIFAEVGAGRPGITYCLMFRGRSGQEKTGAAAPPDEP